MDCAKVIRACIVNDKDGGQAEHLTCFRSATCPKELATTYPSPDDHIRTLYDVLEHTVQRHPEVFEIRLLAQTSPELAKVCPRCQGVLGLSDKLLGDTHIR